MAKNSRARIGVVALGLIMALDGTARAEGLPLRAGAAGADRALASFAEGLAFKLSRLGGTQSAETWSALVDETVLVAGRLGSPVDTAVHAEHASARYAIVLEGDSVISGTDPDRVLGRLLYALAHDASNRHDAPSAAAMAVLDQPLSATLPALASISLP